MKQHIYHISCVHQSLSLSLSLAFTPFCSVSLLVYRPPLPVYDSWQVRLRCTHWENSCFTVGSHPKKDIEVRILSLIYSNSPYSHMDKETFTGLPCFAVNKLNNQKLCPQSITCLADLIPSPFIHHILCLAFDSHGINIGGNDDWMKRNGQTSASRL